MSTLMPGDGVISSNAGQATDHAFVNNLFLVRADSITLQMQATNQSCSLFSPAPPDPPESKRDACRWYSIISARWHLTRYHERGAGARDDEKAMNIDGDAQTVMMLYGVGSSSCPSSHSLVHDSDFYCCVCVC